MQYKTRGIILHILKYGDSGLIGKIYTEQFGIKTYMIRGSHKPGAKVRASSLQHLNLVEFVASGHEHRGMQSIRELRIEYPFRTLPADIHKSSACLFVNEMIYRSLRHEEQDQALFAFIRNSLIWLDETVGNTANFHLWFCLKLTGFLGFCPGAYNAASKAFSIAEGVFRNAGVSGEPYIEQPHLKHFADILHCQIEDLCGLQIPRKIRLELLDLIILYYRFHIQDFGEIRSHKVLAEVYSQ
jgi:DNA repair protein RecO (recombination protein O)